jgi:chromosome segregation ATPase
LGYYEEQATEAAAAEENHKDKFDEASQKIKILEEQLAETHSKLEHFLTEKESLAQANSSLNEGLFSWQNFWRNATVAVSLLFGKYCPIMF